MNDPDKAIEAGRERRLARRKRKKALSIVILATIAVSIIADSTFEWSGDRGTGPLVITLAAVLLFGTQWSDARTQEGIERVIVGRAAVRAMAIVVTYTVVTYVVWLIDSDVEPNPGMFLMVASGSLLVGTMLGDVGLIDRDDE